MFFLAFALTSSSSSTSSSVFSSGSSLPKMMFAYLSTFFSSGCFCSETSSVSSTSASSSRSISSGSLVSKRSCSGSGITSVGPDEELMSSCFSGVSALSFSFSSIFSGSVSEVSAAVGSFFFRPPCCFPRNRSCFYMPHAQAHSCKPLRS